MDGVVVVFSTLLIVSDLVINATYHDRLSLSIVSGDGKGHGGEVRLGR